MSKRKSTGWLADKRKDPEFLRLCAHEDLIEDFLTRLDLEMKRQKITRAELARRMGCQPSNISMLFRRTRNLTAAAMADIAFHLGLSLKLVFGAPSQAP